MKYQKSICADFIIIDVTMIMCEVVVVLLNAVLIQSSANSFT